MCNNYIRIVDWSRITKNGTGPSLSDSTLPANPVFVKVFLRTRDNTDVAIYVLQVDTLWGPSL